LFGVSRKRRSLRNASSGAALFLGAAQASISTFFQKEKEKMLNF
jgi:hypothetical protein